MKSILTLLISVIVLASCSQTDKDVLKAKIKENKAAIQELKKENEKLEDELAKLSDQEEKPKIPVIAKTVTPQTFNHYIEANGLLEADEIAMISPEVAGRVEKIHVSEGQHVQKGQLLVSLNSKVLTNAIKEIETNLALAKTVYERQKNLWDQNIGSEIEYLQAKAQKESLESNLKAQKEQLKYYNVTAPFSGMVDDVIIKVGELASPGLTSILQMVNLGKMKVNADISEIYIPSIQKGDSIRLSFTTYPDLIIEAPLYRTGNIVHPDNRTFNIQVLLNNADNRLKPNMMATLKIKDYSMENALVVPSTIIKNDISGKFLFTLIEGKAQKVYVKTGRSYLDETVVLEGLKPGDKVITKGFNTVSNGVPVAQK